MKVITILFILLNLTACIVHPAHNHKKQKGKTTTVVLEKEHKNNKIVIVNVRPAKSRQCWVHNRHWHCHR